MASNPLSTFYTRYKHDINRGLQYADEFSLRDIKSGDVLPWKIENWSAIQGDAPKDLRFAPYWCPQPSSIHRPMRSLVYQWLNSPKALAATAINGRPRTREEFNRFPVKYSYDEPRKAAHQARLASVLGDVQVDDTVRLSHLDPVKRVLHVQRATYLDQVATNLQTDHRFDTSLIPHQPETSFRELDAENGALKPLNKCYQANTIGVACLLVDQDGVPLLVQRNPDTAVMDVPGKLHCSSSGALGWSDMIDPDHPDQLLPDGPARGMAREINEELGLVIGEHFELEPLMLARELPRAGKPQFFFLARAKVSRRELEAMIDSHLINPGSIGGWEIDPQNRNRLIRVLKPGAKPVRGLLFDPKLQLSKQLRDVVERGRSEFTYEGFAALWYAAAVA